MAERPSRLVSITGWVSEIGLSSCKLRSKGLENVGIADLGRTTCHEHDRELCFALEARFTLKAFYILAQGKAK
jgi:hypothetical protein